MKPSAFEYIRPGSLAEALACLARYGEDVILESFQARPPDYMLLVHQDAAVFDLPFFGQSPAYGQNIMRWVKANYLPVKLIGAEPLQDGRFGIKIMQRRSPGR